MAKQSRCQHRLSTSRGEYPVWAWQQPRPDLRQKGLLPRGSKGVLVEFVAPKSHILLSDFDAWHVVLNNGYLSLSESDDESFHNRRTRASGDPWFDPRYRSLVEASWERIFELPPTDADLEWYGVPSLVQATLPYVCLAWVIRAVPFFARGTCQPF